MKRRFTILTAALALLVSLAIPMGMWGQTRASETFSYTVYTGQGTSGSGSACTATQNGVIIASTKAYGADVHVREYQGSDITISGPTITKIEITCTASGTSNNGPGKLGLPTGGAGNYSYSGKVGTWTGSASSITLHANAQARWTQIVVTYSIGGTYTVTYAANGGTGTMTDSNSPYNAGATVTVLGNEFTRTDYEFDHWNTAADDSGTSYDEDDTFTINANTTLYAQWTFAPAGNLIVDFENAANTYTYWTFTNMTSQLSGLITAHGGSYYGTTGGKEKASIATKMKIATPGSLTCYVSKQSNNTSESTWYIQVSSDGTSWTEVASRSASDMNKGEWKEFTADLSSYTNVYVRVYYDGTTAVRNIDDLTLTTTVTPTISAEGVEIVYNATSGNISYTINHEPDPAGTLTASVPQNSWLTLGTVGATVPFTCSANPTSAARTETVTLTYTYNTNETVTKDVTVTQTSAPYTTIPALFEAATSTSTPVTVSFGNWVVTGVNGNQSFVTDGTNGFIMYQNDHGFEVGDILSGTVNCDLILYSESAEITGLTISSEGLTVAKNGSVTPVVTTINTLQAVNTGSVVTLKNLTYNGEVLTDENNNTIVYYTSLYDGTTLETGKKYNVTGVFFWFNSTKRILPRSAADIVPIFTLTIEGYGDTQNPGGWYLIASPIGNVDPTKVTNMIPADPQEQGYDLYSFDPTQTNEWVNYKPGTGSSNPSFNLEPGKGYLYANEDDVTLVFNGPAYTTENGTFEVTLTKADAAPGLDFPDWNLVGNPFAKTAYIGRGFYTLTADCRFWVSVESDEIEAMQGIFVVAEEDEDIVTFTTEPNSKSSMFALNLSHGRNLIDRAIVRLDGGRQLPKLQFRQGSTKVYIPVDGQDYAIVSCEEMGEMPVSFKAEENGSYTLSLSSEEVSFAYLHLIDNMTGADVDLLETPSYSFEARTTDYANRFKLVFATGDNSNDDNFAFFSNGSFVINNEGNAELQVIDITGRIVKSESINGCTNVNVNAASGVYMLRLINGDNVKVQKVVVK